MKNTKKEPKYLTQKKLTELLSKYYPVKTEVKIEGTKFRSDIQFERNGQKYAVEFDGDSHFTDLYVMDRDIEKDKILKSQNFDVIRIPYWIQIDDYSFYMLFRFDYPETLGEGDDYYPHGFIDKNAKTPAFYSHRGQEKFLRILYYLAEKWNDVFVRIIQSMVFHPNTPENIVTPYLHEEIAHTLKYYVEFESIPDFQKEMFQKFIDWKIVSKEESGFYPPR